MRLIYLLPILSIVFSIVSASNQCLDFIDQLAKNRNNRDAQTQQQKEYFEFSGVHGRGDLGSKTKCEAASTRKYFIIGEIWNAKPEDHTKAYNQLETGICVPNFCNEDSLGPDALRQLCLINNWETQFNLVLHDPNAKPSRDLAYHVIVGIFYVLVATCIVSTLIQNKSKILKLIKRGSSSKGKNPGNWVFRSFDLKTNLKSLYVTAKECGQSDHLSMFGFLRFISIIWIIFFHNQIMGREMVNNFKYPGLNSAYVFIAQGDVAPGYFFYMAGFLAAFTLVGKASREGIGFSKFWSDLVHRFFKIYPGAVVAILFYWVVMPGMMNGTLWNRYIGNVQVCGERWYEKFFLFDNWTTQLFDWCASWTWYIDVDFQIYPVLILLAYLYASKKYSTRVVYGALVLLTAISWMIGLILIETHRSAVHIKFTWYGIPPARIGEPIIGFIMGLQYYEYSKLKLKNNLIAYWEEKAAARYISMACGAFLNIYGIWFSSGNSPFGAFEWEYMRRLFISIGTALFFGPLANNCFSVLKWVMNLRVFQILGKLCFGAYLLHWPIINAIIYTSEYIPDEYDHGLYMRRSIKTIIYSFIAAFVYFLVLEKPLLNIEAHFTKGKKSNGKAASVEVKTAPSTPAQAVENYAVLDDESERDNNVSIQINTDDKHQQSKQ